MAESELVVVGGRPVIERSRVSAVHLPTTTTLILEHAMHPLNLKVLQRHDAAIVSILDSATYVVLYRFQDDAWAKQGTEGTMFISKRCEQMLLWRGPSRSP